MKNGSKNKSVAFIILVSVFTHTQPVTGRFVKHLQLMSSLHFRLGDAESFVNHL